MDNNGEDCDIISDELMSILRTELKTIISYGFGSIEIMVIDHKVDVVLTKKSVKWNIKHKQY